MSPIANDMTITEADIETLAERLGVPLSDDERADFAALVDAGAAEADEYRPPSFPTPGRADVDRPEGRDSDDDSNVWITRFRLDGGDGPLSGVRIGLKDNIAVADYPMTCGSTLLSDFEPSFDATIVQRLLDAGGTIVGKTNMEAFAWSGSSDISDFGTVRNPHDPAFLSGGSSSGSAAAVAANDCEAAIGGDQGGSIRIPSAWCGIVGLKPTHGLVPYTGIYPLDPTIDHAGPMARDVETAAKLLTAIAGEDRRDGIRLDPRQPRGVAGEEYASDLDASPETFSVGVLEEGFGWESSGPEIDATVRATIDDLEERGVTVDRVSVPDHRDVLSLISILETQGGYRTVAEDAVPTQQDGWYWTELARTIRSRVEANPEALPPTTKQALLFGEYLISEYGVAPYGDAKNAMLGLRRAYDSALAERDALVMPTVPMAPYEHDEDLGRRGRLARIVENHRNTATFDHTHHPALSVPCGSVEGLPVGIQLVGSQFDERTLLRIGRLVESL